MGLGSTEWLVLWERQGGSLGWPVLMLMVDGSSKSMLQSVCRPFRHNLCACSDALPTFFLCKCVLPRPHSLLSPFLSHHPATLHTHRSHPAIPPTLILPPCQAAAAEREALLSEKKALSSRLTELLAREEAVALRQAGVERREAEVVAAEKR